MRTSCAVIFLTVVALVGCKKDDEAPGGSGTTDDGPRYATEFIQVDVDPATPAPVELAVQACAGLKNRELGGSVYVHQGDQDLQWLEELDLAPAETVSDTDFVDACVAEIPACVPYSYASQQRQLPSILAAASALGAVPVDVDSAVACNEVVYDARAELGGLTTDHEATRKVFEALGDKTTGLAMLNPGFDIHDPDHADPALIGDMPTELVDFVFSRRLFVSYLINACVGPGPENDLLTEMVTAGHWPTPVGVWGYNDTWLLGGFLYEAQTRCLDARNMGAIPTKTHNLSFHSTRRPPIEEPGELEPIPAETTPYDPNKTYVAFVIGDGDNVAYILGTRNVWLQERMALCAASPDSCPPITWSISPHLVNIAPDVLQWYYAGARQTGRDTFTLPPSGHLYAYPTSLNAADRARFIKATEADARLYGVGGVVHWEWFEDWQVAEDEVLPTYGSADGPIRAIVPVNVPYLADAFPWWGADEFYRVLDGDGGQVVVFRPRQWRGIDGSDDTFFATPQAMSDELAAYPPGTVTAIYTTSDGGLTLANSIVALTELLPDHVELVGVDTAARLAMEASAR